MTSTRIQKLLLSKEYFQFEDLVLVESPFAEITRRGWGLRQIQLAATPNNLILATDTVPPADRSSIFYCPVDLQVANLELVSILPLNCLNIRVFSYKKKILKVEVCNGEVLYFELGGMLDRKAFWQQWCERVKFLAPEQPLGSMSEFSIFTSSSSRSSLSLSHSRTVQLPDGRISVISVYSPCSGDSWMSPSPSAASGWHTAKHLDRGRTRLRYGKYQRGPLLEESQNINMNRRYRRGYNEYWPQSRELPQRRRVICRAASDSEMRSNRGNVRQDDAIWNLKLGKQRAPQNYENLSCVNVVSGTGDTIPSYDFSKCHDIYSGKAPHEHRLYTSHTCHRVNRFGSGIDENCFIGLYFTDSKDTAQQMHNSKIATMLNDSVLLWESTRKRNPWKYPKHTYMKPSPQYCSGFRFGDEIPGRLPLYSLRRVTSEPRLSTLLQKEAVFQNPEQKLQLRRSVSLEALFPAPKLSRGSPKDCTLADICIDYDDIVFWTPNSLSDNKSPVECYFQKLKQLREISAYQESVVSQPAASESGQVTDETERCSSEAEEHQSANTGRPRKKRYSLKHLFRGKDTPESSSDSMEGKKSSTFRRRCNMLRKARERATLRWRKKANKKLARGKQKNPTEEIQSPNKECHESEENRKKTELSAEVTDDNRHKVPSRESSAATSDDHGAKDVSAHCSVVNYEVQAGSSDATMPESPDGSKVMDESEGSAVAVTHQTDSSCLTSDQSSAVGNVDIDQVLLKRLSSLDINASDKKQQTGITQDKQQKQERAAEEEDAPWSLADFDASTLAYQLTLLARDLLLKIHLDELAAWNGLMPNCDAPNITTVISFSHRISQLVATEVVRRQPEKARAETINKWINVAEKCHRIRNFQSCNTVLLGLQSPPVFRLKDTWKSVKSQHSTMYRTFQHLSGLYKDPGSARYQKMFHMKCQIPPFLPCLRDLLGRLLGQTAPAALPRLRTLPEKTAEVCSYSTILNDEEQWASVKHELLNSWKRNDAPEKTRTLFHRLLADLETPRRKYVLTEREHKLALIAATKWRHFAKTKAEARRARALKKALLGSLTVNVTQISDSIEEVKNQKKRRLRAAAEFLWCSKQATLRYGFDIDRAARDYLLNFHYTEDKDNFVTSYDIECPGFDSFLCLANSVNKFSV